MIKIYKTDMTGKLEQLKELGIDPFGQKYAKYTALKTPIGTPKAIAKAVTYILPTIIGNIPKISSSGYQSIPKINSKKPICDIVVKALKNKNRAIAPTAKIEKPALRAKSP